MSSAPANSYDEVPYDSRPQRATHPDSLATLARLLGMHPAPVDGCRVLELGCATCGNLLPMAEALPGSRFVGVDLSAGQIDTGRKVAAALGLDNIDLRACSILDVDDSFGTFDYILCHGVYSWVPEAVREHILAVCRRNLSPHGVAYISYNTYPGWHRRAPVREMMCYHVQDLPDPRQRIAQARALLDFLIWAAPAPGGLWAQLLTEEKELIGSQENDYYLYHDHLEVVNQPFYFHQFMEQARWHDLQFLGEALGASNFLSCPAEVQQALQAASTDLVQLEQYTDFLFNRTFRRTLLVHADVELNRSPRPNVVFGLQASASARPKANPETADAEAVEFHNDKGVSVQTRSPLAKAALGVLFEAWPRPLPFDELWQRAAGRLGPEGADVPPAQARAELAGALVQLYLTGLAGLHVHVPAFTTEPGERPRATPLACRQAETGEAVTNRRHCTVKLGVLDRAVLALLDGSRDRPALVQALTERALQGELELQQHVRPLTDDDVIRGVLEQDLEASLHRLGRSAVLVA
jgi:methyltransferase-like protein/SAM-dependent methyltransferase